MNEKDDEFGPVELGEPDNLGFHKQILQRFAVTTGGVLNTNYGTFVSASEAEDRIKQLETENAELRKQLEHAREMYRRDAE